MVKEIQLQNGSVAIVDDEDFERVSVHTWTVANQGTRLMVQTRIKDKVIILSRLILGVNDSCIVLFKNGDNLDCRKENLLIGTPAMSNQMKRGYKNSTSKYKGVYWSKQKSKWVAQIGIADRTKYLGAFTSEDEAAEVYNRAALEYFGVNGFQNVIGEDNRAKDSIKIESQYSQMRNRLGKCGFRGVTSMKNGKYQAQLCHKYKKMYLGVYDSPEKAAESYDRRAYELHGNKAILNFPERIQEYK